MGRTPVLRRYHRTTPQTIHATTRRSDPPIRRILSRDVRFAMFEIRFNHVRTLSNASVYFRVRSAVSSDSISSSNVLTSADGGFESSLFNFSAKASSFGSTTDSSDSASRMSSNSSRPRPSLSASSSSVCSNSIPSRRPFRIAMATSASSARSPKRRLASYKRFARHLFISMERLSRVDVYTFVTYKQPLLSTQRRPHT